MSSSVSTRDDREPISFPGWKVSLAGAALAPDTRERFRRAILSFLKRCKDERAPASMTLIRRHLEAAHDPAAREALRWFYRSARAGPGLAQVKADKPTPDERRGSDFVAGSVGAGARADTSTAPPHHKLRSDVPPAAAADRGEADWERDLIAAARERGFLWRTEETYRMWGERFAKFLAPRSPAAAEADDVAGFLSALAVEQRASPSTQKQAA